LPDKPKEPAGRRSGVPFSFVYFLLGKQKKWTRSRAAPASNIREAHKTMWLSVPRIKG
jgi:hypothetical protein